MSFCHVQGFIMKQQNKKMLGFQSSKKLYIYYNLFSISTMIKVYLTLAYIN